MRSFKRFLRLIFWPVRAAWRLIRRSTALLVTLLLLAVLATGMLATTIPVVYGTFSTLSETIMVAPSLRESDIAARTEIERRQRAERDARDRRIADLDGALDEARARNTELESRLDERDSRIATLDVDPAARRVTYRGEPRAVGDIVSETAHLIRSRAAAVATRNIDAMPGEAVPVFGIAVITAATTRDIAEACEMMGDLHEMTLALDPAATVPPEETEVCGLQVPTPQEVWARVQRNPEDVWAAMDDMHGGLPPLHTGLVEHVVNVFSGAPDSILDAN